MHQVDAKKFMKDKNGLALTVFIDGILFEIQQNFKFTMSNSNDKNGSKAVNRTFMNQLLPIKQIQCSFKEIKFCQNQGYIYIALIKILDHCFNFVFRCFLTFPILIFKYNSLCERLAKHNRFPDK